tara:strand:- start:462 stop:644 length:183 start_codon:yes stop_codon:yes gene_type:complete
MRANAKVLAIKNDQLVKWSGEKRVLFTATRGTLVFTTFFAFISIGCTALLGSFFFPATRA